MVYIKLKQTLLGAYDFKMDSQTQIPEKFKKFFWDIEFEDLDIQRHKAFIITRLLNFGDQDCIKWLFSTYSKEEIKDVVKNSRSLLKKPARFWQLYFNLKEDEMRCFEVFKKMEGMFPF
ncbi:DUF6922 domain-containing protein [Caldicellulosiruptor changbaiensis]|nr:hypothetical protein [Caldicellulosiruptor changbaiensis]